MSDRRAPGEWRAVRAWTALAVGTAAIWLGACAQRPHLLVSDPPSRTELEAIVRDAPLAAGENIRPKELRRGPSSSAHLVRIRDREQPHVHTRYDLTVVLVGGRGTLWLAGKPLPMREGDVALIPKETPHYFVNESRGPAAALVVFSPPFDGPDQRPVP
jgi:mannose-6-phosphate isomerase-like protein (cupin superfamily)